MTKIILKKSINYFLILITIFLLFGCESTRIAKEDRIRKIKLLNESLDACFDVFVYKKDAISENELQYYQKNRAEAGRIWQEFSTKNKEKYYRDPKVKKMDRYKYIAKGIFTLGIGFFTHETTYAPPPYDNFDYKKTKARPNYSGVIPYCDQKIDRLASVYAFNKKIKAENDHAKNLGFPKGIWGYDRNLYEIGILDVIVNSLTFPENIARNNNYLIKRGNEVFRVQNIVGNYVIYSYLSPEPKTYRFALEAEAGKSYLQDSLLTGKHFATTGTLKIPDLVNGTAIEILAFKKIE